MKIPSKLTRAVALTAALILLPAGIHAGDRATEVSIVGEQFHINGKPTYEGVKWEQKDGGTHRIEGLLMNSRMVQGIFDDLNPETRDQWAYADTGKWDPDRNTDEFVRAMESWRAHGLLAFTINLQGGSPQGYSQEQPWENSAFDPKGGLREDYMRRLSKILKRADELGMVAILGYFYFGQDERLEDEAAVIRGVDNATRWVLENNWRNVIIEINNECNVRYDHPILQPGRVHELIERVRKTEHGGRRLLVSTSYGGGTIPGKKVLEASDYALLHGNGVRDPERMVEMIARTREMMGDKLKPIVNNEDDRPWRDAHQGFGEKGSNFTACVENHASWGYFDFREKNEPFDEGFQSIPVNWEISSPRKKGFFDLLKRITSH